MSKNIKNLTLIDGLKISIISLAASYPEDALKFFSEKELENMLDEYDIPELKNKEVFETLKEILDKNK